MIHLLIKELLLITIITCELDFSVQVVDLWSPPLSVQVETAETDRQADRRSVQRGQRTDKQAERQVDTPECVDTVNSSRHVLPVVDVRRLWVEDLKTWSDST